MTSNVARLFERYSKGVNEEASKLVNDRNGLLSRDRRQVKPKLPHKQVSCENKDPSDEVSQSIDSAVSLCVLQWRSHEDAWRLFERDRPECVHLSEIPFPPSDSEVLEFLILLNGLDMKVGYKRALLRWHPDKFMQNFGSLLIPSEKEKVRHRLNGIVQAINVAWGYLLTRKA